MMKTHLTQRLSAALLGLVALAPQKLPANALLCSSAIITNPAPARVDIFGASVAGLGSDRILIGAPGDDPGAIGPKFYMGPGAVYVYDLAGAPLNTLTNPSPDNGDGFGYAVAAVGTDKALVGAPQDSTGAFAAGVAHLLDHQGNLLVTVTNPTPAYNEGFGCAVAAVGTNRLVIGAYYEGTGAPGPGGAYLYDLQGNLLVTLTNPAPAAGDLFGGLVAAVGEDKVLIGAYAKDLGATNAGAAYLYDLQGNLMTTFTNPAPAPGDNFGISLSAVGTDQVLIGAPGKDLEETNAGAAYLYNLQGNLLLTLTNPVPGTNTQFGGAVAGLGATGLLVSAPGGDLAGTPDAGLVYLFDLQGRQLAVFNASGPDSLDNFGAALGVLGESAVLVGAPNSTLAGEPGAGAAHVFELCPLGPELIIQPADEGLARISWTPATGTNWILQERLSLTAGSWSNSVSGSTNPVVVPSTLPRTFYRLHKP